MLSISHRIDCFLSRWGSICRNLSEWTSTVSSKREESEKTHQLLQLAVSIHTTRTHTWNRRQLIDRRTSLINKTCSEVQTLFPLFPSLSGTPSLKVAATGRTRIDPPWQKWAESSSRERRAPLTKSSRRLGRLTSSSICRKQVTGKPTATLSSDQKKYIHCTNTPVVHFYNTSLSGATGVFQALCTIAVGTEIILLFGFVYWYVC